MTTQEDRDQAGEFDQYMDDRRRMEDEYEELRQARERARLDVVSAAMLYRKCIIDHHAMRNDLTRTAMENAEASMLGACDRVREAVIALQAGPWGTEYMPLTPEQDADREAENESLRAALAAERAAHRELREAVREQIRLSSLPEIMENFKKLAALVGWPEGARDGDR